MSKYCSACGHALQDGARFCSACGAPVPETEITSPETEITAPPAAPGAEGNAVPETGEAQAPAGQPAAENTSPQSGYYAACAPACSGVYPASAYTPPRKSRTWLIVLIAVAVVAVVGIAVVLAKVVGGASSSAYRRALDTYFQASYGLDTKLVEDCAPAAFWDTVEADYGCTVADVAENIESYVTYFEEEYGLDYEVSYEIKETDRMDSDDVDEAARYLKKYYGIDKNSVTVGYELELKYTLSGSRGSESDYISCVVFKIGNEWYVCDEEYDFYIFYDLPYADEDYDYSDFDDFDYDDFDDYDDYDYDYDFDDYDYDDFDYSDNLEDYLF